MQVNASIFSPLTLEQFGKSNILTGLIVLYVSSILVDLLYLITLSSPLYVISVNLNLTIGIAVGLATTCLLSLIPIQQVMANLVAPETVLRRTARDVDPENLIPDESAASELNKEEIEPPERTPLLTIEQILKSSAKRDDEFTVRQSIHSLYEVISEFIQYCDEDGRPIGTDRSSIARRESTEQIFEYWDSCIEIGSDGGQERINLLNATHVRLTSLLIDSPITSVEERLDELVNIHIRAFEIGYLESELLDSYSQLMQDVIDSEKTDLAESVISSTLNVSERLVSTDLEGDEFVKYLSGERRDIVATSFSVTISCLQALGKSDIAGQGLLRRCSENTINRIDIILTSIFEDLEESSTEENDPQGVKQNLLSEIQSAIFGVISSIHSTDSLVARNLMIAVIELSIIQGHNPEKFGNQMQNNISEETVRLEIISEIRNSSIPPSFRRMEVPQSDIEGFIQGLEEQLGDS
ncbi:hypothetical protein GCM10009000_115130 [Halobacterium noricense]